MPTQPIRAQIDTKRNIPSDLVESYLYAAAVHPRVFVSDTWESYGLEIRHGAGAVTPQQPVESRTKMGNAPALDNAPQHQIKPEQHKTLCTVLLSIYRLGQIDKVRVGQYYTTMEGKIQGLFRVSPFDDEGRPYMLGVLVQKYSPWASLPTFERLVAAYDMVLEKAEAPWTLMRVATVTCAYNGCNTLLSLNHFRKKLGLPMEDALGYLIYPEAGTDLMAICWSLTKKWTYPIPTFLISGLLGFPPSRRILPQLSPISSTSST